MVTWDDCIKLIDAGIEELKQLMNSDPLHGVRYQQRMAVMMHRKSQAIRAKSMEVQCAGTNQQNVDAL